VHNNSTWTVFPSSLIFIANLISMVHYLPLATCFIM
jgi:hypothetical protein